MRSNKVVMNIAASLHHSRRHLLEIGGLSLLGLGTGDLLGLRRLAAAGRGVPAAPRARSCVFVFLFGGPSHIDLWDMKPEAPVEVRGEFRGVSTSVAGIRLCEHLPRLAQRIDKLCLLRSMTHDMNVHGPAMSELYTGRPYPFPPTTDQSRPEDWPSMSSLAMRFGQPRNGLPPSIVLPWYLQFPGQSRLIAGQTAGRMGRHHDAVLADGDPSRDDFHVKGFELAEEVSTDRFRQRRQLLQQVERLGTVPTDRNLDVVNRQRDTGRAFDFLERQAGRAFNLAREPQAVRDAYGDTRIGQSLLLTRRLIEAGVPLVTVNWLDPTMTDGVNTCWDTHQRNFPKLTKLLCPMFDRCFPAFLDDLEQRGLLETTLVVAVGEFGRTPKMGEVTQSNNTKSTGRDHWPHAFTALLAGGGVGGGQVYGATTRNGGHVADKPVSPSDLHATIYHHLGIDTRQKYFDEFQGISRRICEGRRVRDL
ncbi:MAG: hypothetical protein CMJ65_09010 [Planctomycetaceae bacterium]|nr:hypothetical protein [Planctomycetaceae bacterium]